MPKYTTVSVDPDVYVQLKRLSQMQERTVAATLKLLIQQACAEAGI